ncbi:hypothetical protein D3C73_1451200 [compost metagenome]
MSLAPAIVLNNTGQSADQKMTTTFSAVPMPKKIMKIGMIAKGFSFSQARRKGSSAFSALLKKVPSRNPSGMPTISDRPNPSSTR